MRRLAVLAALGLAAAAAAQQGASYWEARYGPIATVSIDNLINESAAYEDRGVNTAGRFDTGSGLRDNYRLRGNFGGQVSIVPMEEVAFQFERDARQMMGREVEVTGVYHVNIQDAFASGEPSGVIEFWSYVGPPEEVRPDELKGATISLEKLVTDLGSRDGRTVRVVGKFRGRNLYGDLPAKTQRKHDDWVIKDDLFAVWIVGHKPKGDGFELDAGKKRDTGKWVEVIGTAQTAGGVTYIRAKKISLSEPPTPTATAAATPTPEPRPQKPPVVVFALPLDGEVVPSDSRFVVQFSKDMEVSSFDGRVALRYAGPLRPGDRPFDGLVLSYDGGRRALTVDPGDVLRPGRVVELLLLGGIQDIEGLTLEARREGLDLDVAEVVEVLRYRVGG